MRNRICYLPSWDILSELLIDDATNGHQVGIAWHLCSVVHPKVVLKILAERFKQKKKKGWISTNQPFLPLLIH